MSEPTITTRDREIAERILGYDFSNHTKQQKIDTVATILSEERDERMERVHKLLNELATNSKETIVLLYVNRIREELK